LLDQLNQLMRYIDEHLTEELSPQDITRLTGLSDYHFRRMFSYMSGVTLTEYIKQRRLSEANRDLIQGASVTTVAFQYGFRSVEGFSRAFRNWSGYLPSFAIKHQIQKNFPPFTFYLEIKGGTSMEFKIEEKSSFFITGVSKRVPIQFEGVNESIIELAQSITTDQRRQMKAMADLYPNHILNVSFDHEEQFQEETGSLTHMLGYATTQKLTDSGIGLEQLYIDASTWVIFPNRGPFPATLQDTMARSYSEWLPSSGYELIDLPAISFTIHGDDPEQVYSEVWVAVSKKSSEQ